MQSQSSFCLLSQENHGLTLESSEPPSKKARTHRYEDSKVNKNAVSLLCNETLDDILELPQAGSSALAIPPSFEHRHSATGFFLSLPSILRPPFTERLIVNLLGQVKSLHSREWEQIEKSEIPDFLNPSIMVISKALSSSESPEDRHQAFVAGTHTAVLLCNTDSKYREIKSTLLRMVATFHTEINALKIHKEVLNHYLPASIKPEKKSLDYLLSGIPEENRPIIVNQLANLWDISRQSSGDLNSYIGPNLPNKLFKVCPKESGKEMTFFRMQSPETHAGELSPFYELFLDHHEKQSTSHMSLIMLSPSVFDQEQLIAQKRFEAQQHHSKSLFAWACEPDTDFVAQDGYDEKKESMSSFMENLDEQLIQSASSSFKIPDHVRKSQAFEDKVEEIIMNVKMLLFSEHKKLTPNEKRDFILMSVVLLLEYFCETLDPQTVDTACRSHIDRGIMISSVFYIYLMIKSEKDKDPEFIEYLKPFILAPALTVAQRPPHEDKMRAILSLTTRLLQPKTVDKIQKTKTFFSNCTLDIPLVR